MVQLSLEELKSVLKLLKDKKRSKRKNKRKRKRQADGYNIGGMKSDSSHMTQGYSQAMPFSNTSNVQTEIQNLQRNLLENQIKNPERFNRSEPPNNLLTIEDFQKSMNLFGNQLGNYYDSRIGLLEDKANQFASDLNYGKSDLIRNKRNEAYIEQLPEDEDEDIKPIIFRYDDGIDVSETKGSDFFKDAGNKYAYAEDDEIIREEYIKSPLRDEPLSEKKSSKIEPQTPYFENTDVYPSKTPSIYFNQSGKAEPVEEDTVTPKKSKNIIQKSIKGIARYFTPTNKEDEIVQASTPALEQEPKSNQLSTGTRQSIDIAQMEHFDTDWYKTNVKNVIAIQQSEGFPKGNAGDERFRQLFFNLGLSLQEIDNYIARSKYNQRRDLYKAVYNKVRANNNKILKKQAKEK